MAQPPPPGPGQGADPGHEAGLPGSRDGRLAAFAEDGPGDTRCPGPGLAALLAEVSGPEQRCAGATDDELAGLLGRWAAMESWAAAAKLGVLREMIRRHARPGLRARMHGDLPDAWEDGLAHEVTAALGMSLPAADKLLVVAWELAARLPGIGAKLADGTIDLLKAKIVVEELFVLDDENAARAEAMIIDDLAGKTPGMIGKLAAAAVVSVDPEGARKRREQAERDEARVRFWRENGGACALAGYGLPTDAALAANAAVNQRAQEYKKARVSPDATMDQLRVLAFLDILNSISAADRIAQARAAQAEAQAGGQGSCSGDGPGGGGGGGSSSSGNGGDDGPAGGQPAASGTTGMTGMTGTTGTTGTTGPALPARVNLTIPFATLLDLAERPAEANGLGPLDPALARDLAAAAARSPHSEWCVTVTNAAGWAIGHGCARPAPPAPPTRPARPTRTQQARHPPPGRDDAWAFTRRDGTGPPGEHGCWTITVPGGRNLTVELGPVPLTECDHRYESRGYQPSDTLRHLVQIRDGKCTFPCCSRPARESDFEHAVPFDNGGRTCACNAGMRSRRCHRVKQSSGWKVDQPLPGWHMWTTPSGRTYTQGPRQYPA